jgi:hypothetical protein
LLGTIHFFAVYCLHDKWFYALLIPLAISRPRHCHIWPSQIMFFFTKSTFFHAGQREKKSLELLFFTLEAAA